jgi:hypothetical protein
MLGLRGGATRRVVAEQHEASLLAGHGVSQREALAAAVVVVGEAEWDESESHSKAVLELVGRELGAV